MGYSTTTGGAIESMVNPTSSYNLTMQWAAEAREARDRAEWEAIEAANRKNSCMSSAERKRISTPTFYAIRAELGASRKKAYDDLEGKQFSFVKLVSSWFSSR